VFQIPVQAVSLGMFLIVTYNAFKFAQAAAQHVDHLLPHVRAVFMDIYQLLNNKLVVHLILFLLVISKRIANIVHMDIFLFQAILIPPSIRFVKLVVQVAQDAVAQVAVLALLAFRGSI
jgi:hypothetical protein